MWLRFCKWVRKAVIRGNPARITSYFCLRFYPGLSIRGLSLGWDLTAGSRYRLDACPSATETQCTASLGTIAASSVQSENVTNESPPRRRCGRSSLPPQYSHIDPRSLAGRGSSAHTPGSKPSFIMMLLYATAFPITAHFQSGSSSSGGTAGRPLSEVWRSQPLCSRARHCGSLFVQASVGGRFGADWQLAFCQGSCIYTLPPVRVDGFRMYHQGNSY